MTTTTAAPVGAERDAALTAVVEGIVNAVADDPAAGEIVFRATGAGAAGVRTDVTLGRHSLVIDEPSPLGGGDEGANPVEHALAGLLSCQVITYRFWAARLGIQVTDISAEVEGDFDARGFLAIDDSVRPGFGEVRVRIRLDGPESPERYEELRRTVDSRCPVLDLFRHSTPVSTVLVGP